MQLKKYKFLLPVLILFALSSCQREDSRVDNMNYEFPPEITDFIPYENNPVFSGTEQGTWDDMIRERGFILFDEGVYKMWYTGYNDSISDIKYLGYAISEEGVTWERYSGNPVFSGKWAEDMFVFKHEDDYYMYAEGRDDVAHMMTSRDGITWEEQGDLTILKTTGDAIPGPYGTPVIWIEDGKWYLFYERNDEGIWIATSEDKLTWTNIQDEPVIKMGPEEYDSGAVAANQVIKHKGKYYIYYHGSTNPNWADPDEQALWTSSVAMSADLINWTKYPGNPVVEGDHSSPIVVFDGNQHRLYTMHDKAWMYTPASTEAKIGILFSPPPEYENESGDYRSPLQFYDGRMVKTPGEWDERRDEILNRWHEMMGEWPPLIENPKFEFIESVRKDNYTRHKILLEWREDEMTTAYLLVPEGEGPYPAVITVYYEPETAIGLKVEKRDFACQLAKRGFVTLSVGTSATKDSKPYAQYYPDPDNVTVEPLSMLACLAANSWNFLAKRPEVDSARIGITGHSYGGKWAMFASCLYEKFACAAWSAGGIVFDESRPNVNYWEPWYLGYHRKPWRKAGVVTEENPARGTYHELVKNGYDLHELHALMAPRPFLVSGGSEDQPERWIPLNHSIAVNNLLGYKYRVAMTNRTGHAPTEGSNEQMYLFFEYFLKGEDR
ncbi:MAG: prolyl oligopeptidase family serine peptidase [Prolixibacteraceae bacterium]|nr:prolyl oligopeptidase family serine peptidase [Prolixibacteraceae bacterium]